MWRKCISSWKSKKKKSIYPLSKQFRINQMNVYMWTPGDMGFPGSSAGKESAWNAGDPGSIPGLGRPPAEGIGYPLQYSWASLVAQMLKNPPAIWEIWVWSLGQEDRLEEGMETHSSILAWRIPTDREGW